LVLAQQQYQVLAVEIMATTLLVLLLRQLVVVVVATTEDRLLQGMEKMVVQVVAGL
jgi:hypothetical protein